MLRTLRKDKKTLVVKEKMTQSATRPMSGPCTPINLPAQEAPNFAPGRVGLVAALSLGWGDAIGVVSISVSVRGRKKERCAFFNASPRDYDRFQPARNRRCRSGERFLPGFR